MLWLSHLCVSGQKPFIQKKNRRHLIFSFPYLHSFQFAAYSSCCHFGNCYFHLKIIAKTHTFLRGVTVLKCQVKEELIEWRKSILVILLET